MKKKFLLSLFFLVSSIIFYRLFLKNLGQAPLRSWDEAWYAEIARNILKTGNWFLLQWNGQPYYDHPPLGFWLMALSFKIFGVSEFSARLPSAIAGISSIILIYCLGKKLFYRRIGLFSGIILATIPWFWLRSREGNLDIILTCLMLLSLLLIFKIKDNKNLLPLLGITFGLALLTKTIIAAGLLPVIFFLILNTLKQKSKISKTYLLFTVCCLVITVLPWYFVNYQAYGIKFLDRNIFVTGLKLPGYGALFSIKSANSSLYLKNVLSQIQNGISLWYKPFIVSTLFGLLFLKQRSFLVLYLWLVPYLLIFSLSAKVELWHFIIIYPAISILIPAFLSTLSETTVKYFSLNKNLSRFLILFGDILFFLFFIWNSSRIIKGLYKDIVRNQPVNDEIVLAKSAGENQGTIYIDDDYWPAAVFYSKRKVYSLPHSTDTNIKSIKQLFSEAEKPFQLLTKQWILERDNISTESYEVLNRIWDRVLVKSKQTETE